jgi:hypothetical protein
MRRKKWAQRKLQLKEWYFASLDRGEHGNSLLDPLIAPGCYAVAQKASMRRANCQMIKQRVYLRKRFHCRRGVKCARRRDKISKFAQHTLREAARTPKSAPRNLLQMVYVYILYTAWRVYVCITGGPSHKLLFSFFLAPCNIRHGHNFWDDAQAAKHTSGHWKTGGIKQRQVRKFRHTHRPKMVWKSDASFYSVMSYLFIGGCVSLKRDFLRAVTSSGVFVSI